MRWDSSSEGVPLFVHVAGGVFVGVLAAAFVVWRVAEWRAEKIAAEAAELVQQQAASMAAELKRGEEEAKRAELARRRQLADAQHAQEAAKRAASDEASRRDAAWAGFYKKPASCDESRGGSWTVDCANAYMRAKQRFSELYDAGKL